MRIRVATSSVESARGRQGMPRTESVLGPAAVVGGGIGFWHVALSPRSEEGPS